VKRNSKAERKGIISTVGRRVGETIGLLAFVVVCRGELREGNGWCRDSFFNVHSRGVIHQSRGAKTFTLKFRRLAALQGEENKESRRGQQFRLQSESS